MKKNFKKIMTVVSALIFASSFIYGSSQTIQAKTSKKYTIQVNLGTNCTTIYDNKGKAVKAMICSPSAETPTGTFHIPIKYRWHDMIGNCYAQYCSRITTGVLFHSVWYYKKGDKSTMSVGAYNVMGQKASHGCVRLLCKDAKWIYDHCAVGTKVVIFWGKKKDDPIRRPSFIPLKTKKRTDWDPTDCDPKNPYRKYIPSVKVKKRILKYGKKYRNLIRLVMIKDSFGNIIKKSTSDTKIKIKGKINTEKAGTQKIKFIIQDVLGHKTAKTVQFKVRKS